MTYQDEIARRMRPFIEFSRVMNQLPSLKRMKSAERKDLLRDFYDLAAGKALRDRWAERQWHYIPLLREQGREIYKVVTVFSNVAQALEGARKSRAGSIFEVEDAYIGKLFESAAVDKNKNGLAAQTVLSPVGNRANSDFRVLLVG